MFSARNWLKRLPIRRKLTLLMMTTAAAALLLAGISFVANDLVLQKAGMLDRQSTMAEIVGLNSTAALDFNDSRSARETLTALEADADVMAAAVYSSNGRLFALYINPDFPGAQIPEVPGELGGRFTLDFLETFQPVTVRGEQIGTVLIRSSTEEWFARLQSHIVTGVVVLAIVGMVSLALSHILQRIFSVPILELAQLARRVSETGSYGLRARKYSADELGRLVDDFNAMLEEIQRQDQKLSEYGQGLEREVESRTAELQQLTERLEHQAYHDSLTGLPNRKRYEESCHEALAQSLRDGGQFALMFMDLERFKLVNDSLGHHVGDQLLRVVAKRLRNCIRSGDLVARQGGDEFTVLLRSTGGRESVRQAAERILAALAPRVELQGHTLHITGSIGISVYPDDGHTVDELVRHADVAMYAAKNGGGNRYHFFSPELKSDGAERLSLETDLRRAIDQRQFEVHYQPIMVAQDQEVRCFEALVRWHHPTAGMVPPDRFIPLAEENGLIAEIDELVFREACTQAMAWQARGASSVSISVNLSGRQFVRADLPERMRAILEQTGANCAAIELEITESTLMHHTEQVQTNLMRLKSMGFRLAVDDFGTGYSSLSYLKRFPLDRLKIDKSFVQDLPEDKDNAAITKAIIALAQSLNLKVTVEGVETEQQLQFFDGLACDSFQGFLFSRPLPAADAERFLFQRLTVEECL